MATTYYNNSSATSTTWYNWNRSSDYRSTASTDSAWNSWTSDTTVTTAPGYLQSGDGVWYIWTTTTATVTEELPSARRRRPQPVVEIDPLAVQRMREERKRIAAEEKERAAKIREAERVARETLMSVLTKEQLERFERDECIPVDIEAEKFVITKGIAGNVKRVNEQGKVLAKICCHPTLDENGMALPVYDVMLAQLLHLKCNKEAFLKTANITPQ